jgi:hypothetical protein
MPGGQPVQTATVKSTVSPSETMDLTRDLLIKQARFDASRDRVWNAMLQVHEVLGISFLAGDAAGGNAHFESANRIRTIAGKPASRYVDCGMGPAGARADSYRLVIRVSHVFENPKPDNTIVTTTMQAWARNPALSSDAIPCASTGLLEAEIGGMIATRLQ